MASFERFEIQGLKENSKGKERWYPLYQCRSAAHAKGVLRRILQLSPSDPLSAEVADYEDFRIQTEEVKDWRQQPAKKTIAKSVEQAVAKPPVKTDKRTAKRHSAVRQRRSKQR